MRRQATILAGVLSGIALLVSIASAQAATYRLRLVVELPEEFSGYAVAASFSGVADAYLLTTNGAGIFSRDLETDRQGCRLHILKDGAEVERSSLSWRAYSGEQTTVIVSYPRDQLGRLGQPSRRQVGGLVDEGRGWEVPIEEPTVTEAVGTATRLEPLPGLPGGVPDANASPVLPGPPDSQPAGFSPVGAMTVSPARPPATGTTYIATSTKPVVRSTVTVTASIIQRKVEAGSNASSGPINPALAVLLTAGVLIVAAGIFGPRLLSSGSNRGATEEPEAEAEREPEAGQG